MWASACAVFDLGRIAAIDVLDGKRVAIEEGEMRQLRARAVSARGDSVPEADIVWQRVDLDSGATSFTIDSSGLVTGLAPGSGQVVAQVEEVRSGVIRIDVAARPDLLRAADSLRFQVAASDTLSPSLSVLVLDLTTSPGDTLPLAAKPVHYAVVQPAGAVGVALALPGSAPGTDVSRVVAYTNVAGNAQAVIMRLGIGPDSSIVEATAVSATGDTIAGSPVRFVVLFGK